MNKELIKGKLDLVIAQLLDLKLPDVDDEVKQQEDGGLSRGLYPRDFGMDPWDWPQGVGLYGLSSYNKHVNYRYEDYITNWYQTHMEDGITNRNINTTAPLLTLVDYMDEDEEISKFCVDWAWWLVNELPKTKQGCFQHVTSDVSGDGWILNEDQIWIDTIFMSVLFLNKVGNKIGEQKFIDEGKYQVLQHIKYLVEKDNDLFHHGYTFKEENNFGEVFWCRGNSWFTYGIIDYLEMLEDADEGFKRYVLQVYKNQVNALVKLQDEGGLWHTVLDDNESYVEVSGSACIVAGILKGIRLGILDESYYPYCEKAIEAIINEIANDGTVLSVSGGTGIGLNKQHYKDIIITPIAYGQSLVIIALSEYLNHIDK